MRRTGRWHRRATVVVALGAIVAAGALGGQAAAAPKGQQCPNGFASTPADAGTSATSGTQSTRTATTWSASRGPETRTSSSPGSATSSTTRSSPRRRGGLILTGGYAASSPFACCEPVHVRRGGQRVAPTGLHEPTPGLSGLGTWNRADRSDVRSDRRAGQTHVPSVRHAPRRASCRDCYLSSQIRHARPLRPDGATGEILWSFASGGSCRSGAAISQGRLYWGSGYSNLGFGTPNNRLYSFGCPARATRASWPAGPRPSRPERSGGSELTCSGQRPGV